MALRRHFKVERSPAFIGKNKCPRILEILSEETNGAEFQVSTGRYGVIRIEERHSRQAPELVVP